MSDVCLTCGGLIMEPNVPYMYAGKVCHCFVPPKIQRPSLEMGCPHGRTRGQACPHCLGIGSTSMPPEKL